MVPPPTPFHILRAHASPLSVLRFGSDNTTLLAGDQSGTVSITDLRARRVRAAWKAHEGGVLGVGEWDGGVVTDNIVKLHEPLVVSGTAGDAGAAAGGAGDRYPPPGVRASMPANALNFCAFSLAHDSSDGDTESWLALPNLADSELLDVYALPSLARVHAALNYAPKPTAPADGLGAPRTGIVMSVHLQVRGERLLVAAGFEDGRVEVWACPKDAAPSDGRNERVWERLWSGKCHNEAVMAMAVDPAFERAFTVSADHRLVRVDLAAILAGTAGDGTVSEYSTKQVGNGAVAISADGRVVAVGGWDGRIRLFSTATFKPLGTLAYHRESVHALAFPQRQSQRAPLPPVEEIIEIGGTADAESDSDDEDEGAEDRSRWLASGGKDARVALWCLMDFAAR